MGVNGFERRLEALEQRQRDALQQHAEPMDLGALTTAELHTMRALIKKATPGAVLEIELLTEAERDTMAELIRKARRS
jgi:hypothetical protein